MEYLNGDQPLEGISSGTLRIGHGGGEKGWSVLINDLQPWPPIAYLLHGWFSHGITWSQVNHRIGKLQRIIIHRVSSTLRNVANSSIIAYNWYSMVWPGGHEEMSSILADHWPIAPSYMSPNAGGGEGLRGSRPMSTPIRRNPNKLWLLFSSTRRASFYFPVWILPATVPASREAAGPAVKPAYLGACSHFHWMLRRQKFL